MGSGNDNSSLGMFEEMIGSSMGIPDDEPDDEPEEDDKDKDSNKDGG